MINAIKIIKEHLFFQIGLKMEFCSNWLGWEFKYLGPSQKDETLILYIEKQVRNLAKIENVEIFDVSFDELNKEETDKNEFAVAKFIYFKNKKTQIEHEKLIADFEDRCKFFLINDSEKIITKKLRPHPRIEISEEAEIWSLLHELGHYFMYKRDKEQSEKEADLYIEEFFDNYLPAFFKWIFQIEIKIYSKRELKFSEFEGFQY